MQKMDERIQKYFEGELPLRDRVTLLKEAEINGELKEALIRRQHLQALTGLTARPGDEDSILGDYAIFCNKARRKARRTQLRRIFVHGLIAACLVGLTWVAAGRYFSPEIKKIEEKYNTLYVPAGQRLNFTLEDGTSVWLNARSRLSYPVTFQGKERRVRVEGEAFFEVARDTERPFIVSSERVDMKVLGTTFNVYSYPDEPYSRISLLEGSLLVYDPQDPSKAVRLKKFEEVVVQQDGRMSVFPATANVALWKEGIYSFEDEPFGNILKKLELYYDITIEVKEPSMLEWRYTVKFRQRDGIDEIFRLLRRIHPFRLVKDSENNRITIHT
jgi:ferric-dicitrate binding protein FerR (iron transport regulator)